jgi:hypothetical protein
MTADMDVDMTINITINIDVDIADDVGTDSPCFHGPISNCPNIFILLII